MSRGIVEAQTLRSEQFEFEARTSDPADAQPGEYWIRVDQTSTNPDVIAELCRQDNSGVTACPIFAASEESNLGADVTRGPSVVLDGGSVGFIAMTTGSGEVGSPRAVNSSGTEYLSHNGLELDPIPDTVVYQYDAQKAFSSGDEGSATTSWIDAVGSADLSGGSPTVVGSGINGHRSVDYDGNDDQLGADVGDITQPFTIFAVVGDVPTSGDGRIYSSNDSNDGRVSLRYSGSNSEWRAIAGNFGNLVGSSDSTSQLVTVRFDGANSVIREDGTQTGSADPGSFDLASINLGSDYGANFFYAGQIGRVEVHNVGLTDTEMSNRESDIADDWGIPL